MCIGGDLVYKSSDVNTYLKNDFEVIRWKMGRMLQAEGTVCARVIDIKGMKEVQCIWSLERDRRDVIWDKAEEVGRGQIMEHFEIHDKVFIVHPYQGKAIQVFYSEEWLCQHCILAVYYRQ